MASLTVWRKRVVSRLGVCLLVSLWVLPGCLQFSPSRTYDNDVVNYETTSSMDTRGLSSRSFTVEANLPWQASDVHVKAHSTIKIQAEGKWSPAPALNTWSGPEGIPGTGKEVPWIKASALMGKIGKKGKPFEIGQEIVVRATEDGHVYLAMNDPFPWVQDNKGSMQVTIYSQAPPSKSPPLPPSPSVTKRRIGKPEIQEKRTALIIGNSQYAIGALKNPAHDAQDMADTLKGLGFVVTLQLDGTQEKMEAAISQFGRELYKGGVGLFYYAGHGIQVGGENFLIPVNAKIESETDVRYKAVPMGQILGKMGEARNGLNIVILDACRDNPFSRGFRSSTRGLAVVSSASAKGTLIAYATSPGKVASDGNSRNGLYTKHLLENMQTPGIPVEQVFKRVLQGVEQETQGKQSPWTSSSFSGDFYFVPE